jgi:hypothetical protein
LKKDKLIRLNTVTMRSLLLLLPLELHLIISDFVEPGDVLSLSSSCKHFQWLMQDRLHEHKYFTKRYRRDKRYETGIGLDGLVSESLYNRGKKKWPFICRLILDIQENPRSAWYIREPLWDYPEHLNFKLTSAAFVVYKQILASRFINAGEKEDWMEATEHANDGIILAILLSQLSHLHSLTLENKPDDPAAKYITRIVSRAAESSHHGSLGQPLSALETVRVRQSPWSGNWDEEYMRHTLRLLIALTTLPNLKNLSLIDYSGHSLIDDESENCSDWISELNRADSYCPLFHGPSQLRSLEIDTGCISASVLSVILKNCAVLEDFTYRIEDQGEVFGCKSTQEAPLPDYLVSTICATLLAHARLSLKSLCLEIEGWEPFGLPTPSWNLHQFATLERLTLDSDLFAGEPDSWPLFADILPVSLKRICILAREPSAHPDNPMIQKMLQNFRPQSFRHLHAFTVWRNCRDTTQSTSTSRIIPTYKSTLSNAGIPQSEIHDYSVDYTIFLERRRVAAYPRIPDLSGGFSWEIHEPPAVDTDNHLIMGVYHSEKTGLDPSHRGERCFDGVRVQRTW